MKTSYLPLLTHRVFNTPLLMHGAEYAAISNYFYSRLGGNGEIEALANDGRHRKRQGYYITPEGFAIIPVIGALVHRGGRIDADCMPITSYEYLRVDYDKAMADPAVNTVIFECDSGGGEARGCFDFASHIFNTKGSKPVLAYINESCYSAMYAIASACDAIYMTSSAGAGSVGVICGRFDQTKWMEANGLGMTLIYDGEHKADFSPFKPMTADEEARLKEKISAMGAQFHQVVATHRGMEVSAVKALKAGTFTGQKAVDVGLADAVMSQDEFYEYLKNREDSDMGLFGKKTEATFTQAQVDAAAAKAAADAKAELVVEAEAAVTSSVKEALASFKKDEQARQSNIVEMCAQAGRKELAGELIAGGLSLDKAREQLFAQASDDDDDIHNHISSPEAGAESRNYLLESCQAAAKAAAEEA